MLNGQSTFKISTRKDEDSDKVDTSLTIVFDATPQVERALATQALVVKWQGQARKNGIPTAATVKMSDFAPGTRHAGMSAEQAVEVVKASALADKAKRAELIAALQAME